MFSCLNKSIFVKNSGFNRLGLLGGLNVGFDYKSEFSTSYELGLKSCWLDQ